MQNLKNFSTTLINSIRDNVINNLPCVSSNGKEISEKESRISEIDNTLKEYNDKISFVAMGIKTGMLNQEQIDKINTEIETQAAEITTLQSEKISLEKEIAVLNMENQGKYKLFDSKLRDAVICGEKNHPNAYKIKKAMLNVLIAIENLDDDDLTEVDDDDVELGIKSAITHHYTERSCKSSRLAYTQKFGLEDSTDAVKKSLNTRLADLVNPLK